MTTPSPDTDAARVAHTAGPWSQHNTKGDTLHCVRAPNDDLVADVHCYSTPGRITREQRAANAALIAASPTMLAALQGGRSLLSVFIGPDDALGQAVIQQMDAAIRLATGEP